MVVSDYILMALFLKFHHVAQLMCTVCPNCSCPSRIRQIVRTTKLQSTNRCCDLLQNVTKNVTVLYLSFSNRDALLMTLSFSLFNGLIASWYSVMNITFSGLPIGEADDADR